ncbi:hypothetical protein BG004_008091 [Podila humilis]|nr:hypothetical protein BG004_008091 [Podila humilis]
MDEDAILTLFTSFRDAERTWIQRQDTKQLTAAGVEIEECSLHFGEMAFVLAGLKPAVLIQLSSVDLTRHLYSKVLEPHFIQHPDFTASSLRCQWITQRARSPEMLLTGCILVWNTATIRHHPQSATIQGIIDKLCPSPSAPQSSIMAGVIVPEDDLALILDIPGRLPGSEAEIRHMVEVSYWQVDSSSGSSTLLTAFAAQPDEIPAIQVHFQRYKVKVLDLFGMSIGIHVQSMASA